MMKETANDLAEMASELCNTYPDCDGCPIFELLDDDQPVCYIEDLTGKFNREKNKQLDVLRKWYEEKNEVDTILQTLNHCNGQNCCNGCEYWGVEDCCDALNQDAAIIIKRLLGKIDKLEWTIKTIQKGRN